MKQENEDIARKMQYILNMRPVFNKEALTEQGITEILLSQRVAKR